MSVFDHLGVLREAFGAALPSLATLVLALAGAALLPSLEVPRVLPLLRLHAHAFLRWRQLVLYRFVYRPLQALFARGILHPKLF